MDDLVLLAVRVLLRRGPSSNVSKNFVPSVGPLLFKHGGRPGRNSKNFVGTKKAFSTRNRG
eukprot:scaffold482_cov266-Amphora_coffeaeformis.AAC.65